MIGIEDTAGRLGVANSNDFAIATRKQHLCQESYQPDQQLSSVVSLSSTSGSSSGNSQRSTTNDNNFEQKYHSAIERIAHKDLLVKMLQDELRKKDAQVVSLEEKLIEMSMELATSRAVEDEYHLASKHSQSPQSVRHIPHQTSGLTQDEDESKELLFPAARRPRGNGASHLSDKSIDRAFHHRHLMKRSSTMTTECSEHSKTGIVPKHIISFSEDRSICTQKSAATERRRAASRSNSLKETSSSFSFRSQDTGSRVAQTSNSNFGQFLRSFGLSKSDMTPSTNITSMKEALPPKPNKARDITLRRLSRDAAPLDGVIFPCSSYEVLSGLEVDKPSSLSTRNGSRWESNNRNQNEEWPEW
jgi:hypothetical protein